MSDEKTERYRDVTLHSFKKLLTVRLAVLEDTDTVVLALINGRYDGPNFHGWKLKDVENWVSLYGDFA